METKNCFVITSSATHTFFIQNKWDAGSKIDQNLGLFNQTQVDQWNNGRDFQVKQLCNYVNHVFIYHYTA